MKHADNGDTETTRSGLFMEAVRIIKEMRRATHGKYPRFAVWENVPGAFSSNKGEDFRTVLEEIIKINDQTAPPLPTPDKGRWPYADVIMGNGWSVAYRTFDAQYWGVPQRRRRIYLVADFTGECAGEILFEREGLRGHFTESGEERKSVASDAQGSPGTADQESTYIIDNIGGQAEYGKDSPVNGTLRAGAQGAIAYAVENHPNDSRVNIDDSGKCQTLTSRMGTGGGNVPMVMEAFCKSGRPQSAEHATTWKHGTVANTLNTFDTGEARANELVVEAVPIHDQATRHTGKRGANTDGKGNGLGIGHPGDPMNTLTSGDRHAVVYCTTTGSYMQVTEDQTPTLMARDYKDPNVVCYGLDRASFNQGANAQFSFSILPEQQPTLTAKGPGAVCSRYIVRRLTPTECARLQGFPDNWGDIPQKDTLTDKEYAYWQKVRNTHAEINGRATKDYTKDQILKWYNKLHSDSSEYKMWGNGIAIPNALYVMQGIADKLHKTREDEHTCKQSTPRKPSTSCGCPARS
jgi:DNA (cytosine-5)-methyltransferase 1